MKTRIKEIYKTMEYGPAPEDASEAIQFLKKYNNKLRFKNLTFAPIEKDLINFKLLNQREKKYLSEYSKKIYFTLSPYLNKYEKNWLRSSIY